MNSSRKQTRSTTSVVFLVILSVLSILLLISGVDSLAEPTGSIYLALGIFGLVFVAFSMMKLASGISAPTIKNVITTIECAKCSFKSIRNFQLGDYIPKPMGACPTCGGSFNVGAIYPEEKREGKAPRADRF